MAYSWLSVALATGEVLADLPGLAVDKVAKQIGAYTSTTAKLAINRKTPDNWLRATLPGGSALILLDEERDVPVWGGMVTHRKRSASGGVDLSVATVEAYFDRRYVGDRTYSATPQSAIVADLVARYVATGSNGGIPIRVVQLSPGAARDRVYTDISDKTVYSVLQELMNVDGGAEWTVEWESKAVGGKRYITPVLYVGTRIGSSPAPGLMPAATFEIPGPVSDASLDEDYTSASGANDVMAVSTASADQRPQSAHAVTPDPDRPTFEARFSPSTSITDVATLNAHAAARAAAAFDGVNALSLESVTKNAPAVGVEWFAGDDVGYVVGGLDRADRDTVDTFPGGITGVARTVGWQLVLGDIDKIIPTLQDPD